MKKTITKCAVGFMFASAIISCQEDFLITTTLSEFAESNVWATAKIAEAVRIPVIASGGAGLPEHLHEVLTDGKADAALVASMVHYGDYRVSGLKQYLHKQGLKIRMSW